MSLRPKRKKQPEEMYECRKDKEALDNEKREYALFVLRQKRMAGTLDEFETGKLSALEAQQSQGE